MGFDGILWWFYGDLHGKKTVGKYQLNWDEPWIWMGFPRDLAFGRLT